MPWHHDTRVPSVRLCCKSWGHRNSESVWCLFGFLAFLLFPESANSITLILRYSCSLRFLMIKPSQSSSCTSRTLCLPLLSCHLFLHFSCDLFFWVHMRICTSHFRCSIVSYFPRWSTARLSVVHTIAGCITILCILLWLLVVFFCHTALLTTLTPSYSIQIAFFFLLPHLLLQYFILHSQGTDNSLSSGSWLLSIFTLLLDVPFSHKIFSLDLNSFIPLLAVIPSTSVALQVQSLLLRAHSTRSSTCIIFHGAYFFV